MTEAKLSNKHDTITSSSTTALAAALQKAGLAPTTGVPTVSSTPKTRRIVTPAPQTTLTPSSAKDIGKAMKSLKTSAPVDAKHSAPVSTIVEAPKARKTHEGVTITVTKEAIVQKDGEPVEMLVLSKRHINSDGQVKSHYNYSFDKGYCYYATKGAETPKLAWKWDPKREVRFIPMDDIETLFKGLREYYAGAQLIVEDKTLTL